MLTIHTMIYFQVFLVCLFQIIYSAVHHVVCCETNRSHWSCHPLSSTALDAYQGYKKIYQPDRSNQHNIFTACIPYRFIQLTSIALTMIVVHKKLNMSCALPICVLSPPPLTAVCAV